MRLAAAIRVGSHDVAGVVDVAGVPVRASGKINRGETPVAPQKAMDRAIRVCPTSRDLAPSVDLPTEGGGRAGGIKGSERAFA